MIAEGSERHEMTYLILPFSHQDFDVVRSNLQSELSVDSIALGTEDEDAKFLLARFEGDAMQLNHIVGFGDANTQDPRRREKTMGGIIVSISDINGNAPLALWEWIKDNTSMERIS